MRMCGHNRLILYVKAFKYLSAILFCELSGMGIFWKHLNFKDRRSKTSKIEVAEPVTVDNIIIISCDQVLELIMNQERKNAKLKTILGHSPYSSGSDKQDDSLHDLKD